MKNRALKIFLGYIGAIGLVDTYRQYSQLLLARNYSKSVNKPLLNLSCGNSTFGDVNADIVPRSVENFVLFSPTESLPFEDNEFGAVYSSHTLEHSEDPEFLLAELNRVADRVYLVLPDFWALPVLHPSHHKIPLNQYGDKWIKNPFYTPRFSSLTRQNFHGNDLVKFLYRITQRKEDS